MGQMPVSRFTGLLSSIGSGGIARGVCGSVTLVGILVYLASFMFGSRENTRIERRQPSISNYVTPATMADVSPVKQVRESAASITTKILEGERENSAAADALKKQLLGSAAVVQPSVASVNENVVSAAAEEAAATPSLTDYSWVGWYDLAGQNARERVVLDFTQFDLERRSIEVRIGSLDHAGWGNATYKGTFDPAKPGTFNIQLAKQTAARRTDANADTIFGSAATMYHDDIWLSLMIDNDIVHGRANGRSGGGEETLILSRTERSKVQRPSGPDAEALLKDVEAEPDPDPPRGLIEGTWAVKSWNGRKFRDGAADTWTFTETAFSWTQSTGAVKASGGYKLEPGHPHPRINFQLANKKRVHGIYQQDQGQLKLCFASAKQPRPSRFNALASGGAAYLVLEAID